MKLNHKDIWTFVYRGISIEIVHWGINEEYCPKGKWNLYLYINPNNIGDKQLRKIFLPKLRKVNWGGKNNKIYDIYSCDLANNLDLHGGVTYLNVENVNGRKILKVGCDYSHLYDDLTDWNENILANHAIDAVNKLHELTEVLIFCSGHGGFYPESEGEYLNEDKSYFYSFEYKNKKK